MGIPSYQSHLRRKYNKQQHLWILSSLPSTHQCTNLYVDLNGIVHTCAQRIYQHYENTLHQSQAGQSYQQTEATLAQDNANDALTRSLYPTLFAAVMADVQQLLNVARPTDLAYLALDGVAPRAKMVQQRQRRFRAVQDKGLEKGVYHRHKRAYIRGELWDSNCVTPGTTFMTALGDYLHAHQSEWTSPGAGPAFQVVVSDATEHGEGEHKIMTHLRAAGDPQAGIVNGTIRRTHVLYGQDADLIMLGLTYLTANPSASFFLLRDVDPRHAMGSRKKARSGRGQKGSSYHRDTEHEGHPKDPPRGQGACREWVDQEQADVMDDMEENGDTDNADNADTIDTAEDASLMVCVDNQTTPSSTTATTATSPSTSTLTTTTTATTQTPSPPPSTSFQYFCVDALQTQIIRHMESYGDLYPAEDQPRAIRDYVAMCFLLGNDFLPHSPSLAIQDKGVDMLFEVYVPLRKTLGTFLTYEHTVELDNCTSRTETHFHHSFLTQLIHKLAQQEDYLAGRIHSHTLQKRKWALQQQRYPTDESALQPTGFQTPSRTDSRTDSRTPGHKPYLHPNAQQHTFEHDMKHLQTLPPGFWAMDDKVLAGTPGWKTRYYREVERIRNMQDVHEMCRRFVEGMFWTLQYYCHGCWSTSWHYPYLSAPLFSNLAHFLEQPRTNANRLVQRDVEWTCTPLEQLRTVLPGGSFRRWVREGGELDGEGDGVEVGGEGERGGSYRLVPFAKRFRWECGVRLG